MANFIIWSSLSVWITSDRTVFVNHLRVPLFHLAPATIWLVFCGGAAATRAVRMRSLC